ncbi:hypothetical protein BDZ97DRAFT_1925388 [Flammula alnicola]|nr:hypothetical protein BDZ97DRAFT_1925388 [Flammula alnicola]
MLLSLLKSPFGRSLLAKSVSRFPNPTVLPALFSGTRSFLTSAHIEAPETHKAAKAEKKPKQAKEKKANPKAPKIMKKDLKPPFKRPMVPWMDFLQKYIAEHRVSGARITSFAPLASVEWAKLTAEEKEAYGCTREEMQEYTEKMKEWRKSLPPTVRKALTKSKKKTARKGPLNAFAQYVKENYSKDSPLTFFEQGKHMGEQYRQLTAEEKDAYRQRSHEAFAKQQAEEAN